MAYWRGECHDTSKNSHKYYEATATEGERIVVVEFGRLPGYGRAGSRQRYVYDTMGVGANMRKFGDLIWSKGRKGYDETTDQVTTAFEAVQATRVASFHVVGGGKSERSMASIPLDTHAEVMARARAGLVLPTDEEIEYGLEGPAAKATVKSKRFARLDLDPLPPKPKASKRFARLEFD